jgi:hypothetical protein
MKLTVVSLALAALAWCGSTISAANIIINPTSDGSLYTCATCNVVSDGAYVFTFDYIQGEVKFSSAAITGTITQAFFTLNPYGLPLFGPNVDVYGYGTSIGQLDVTDANAGTFLGTLVLPANLGFGQDAFFDVTAFVANTQAPFLALICAPRGPMYSARWSTTMVILRSSSSRPPYQSQHRPPYCSSAFLPSELSREPIPIIEKDRVP